MSSVLILGAGIIGLSLARELHKNGVDKITILERGRTGKESSFAAAGMLAPQAEADQAGDFFDFCRDSLEIYPEFAEQLSDETGIDVELDRNGTLYVAFSNSDVDEIRKRFEWQDAAGLDVEHLSAAETHKIEPFVSPDSLESLFFPNDWQVENRSLLRALRAYADINGIEILEQTEASGLTGKAEMIGSVRDVAGNEYFADQFVVASGAWSSGIRVEDSELSIPRVSPVRGQMISFHTAKRLFSRVIYSPRGYVVPRKHGRVLAGATVEHVGFTNETTAEGIKSLKENTLEISPGMANLPVDESWSGLRPFTADGRPVIGEIGEYGNLFVATAHYRNGILLAPITGKILADKMINDKASRYLELCSPNRLISI